MMSDLVKNIDVGQCINVNEVAMSLDGFGRDEGGGKSQGGKDEGAHIDRESSEGMSSKECETRRAGGTMQMEKKDEDESRRPSYTAVLQEEG